MKSVPRHCWSSTCDPETKSSGGVFSLTRQRKQSPITSVWLLKMYQCFINCLTLICWPGDSSLLIYVWHPLTSHDSARPLVWNKSLNKCKLYRRLWAPLQDSDPFLYSLIPTVKEMAVSLKDLSSNTRPGCLGLSLTCLNSNGRVKNDVHHRKDSRWHWAKAALACFRSGVESKFRMWTEILGVKSNWV